MQSPQEIKSRLFSLVNKGIKYDLDRMYRAASLCGDPQKSYKSVHVAGTNGKGSTCTYVESVLRHAGYRTGLYTSPHITNFEERFKIGGIDISEDMWFDVYKEQESIINDLGLTFFEAATLMSFEIFKRAGADYAVFEVGMGGRLDATNIIAPEVSIITKLSLDHQEYLGDTVELIAGEKLGIVKPGVPVIMLDPVNPAIKYLANKKCTDLNSELTFVSADDDASDIICTGSGGVSFIRKGHKYELSMSGKYQVQNALLALTAMEKIAAIDTSVIHTSIKSAAILGRFQIINIGGRDIVVDVGHNPDAAAALVETLDSYFPNRRIHFVVGIMKDKDVSSVIKILSSRASSFYFAKPDTGRAADPVELCRLTENKNVIAESVKEALRMAVAGSGGEDVVCVTGSFFTIVEVFAQQ
ncbi:MAG: bifunctional folylpolyglutamate synthase/dihydrofolate synthase [Chitinispirillia bacterium]|nr:bifunctional folylpolyglutamate synthase/dihydrofolate synthase [Chitinispirillia bacterium]MCL2241292.1 bifunctional folylpolyglutamate synthase/dihydrofolate synthase [Chitinispirillia bacterium]